MIFLAFSEQEQQCDDNGRCFCRDYGDPDAVKAPDQRQEQDCGDLEYQGPQKGDQGGGKAVSQRRKEGGAEDGESCKEEGKGEDKDRKSVV